MSKLSDIAKAVRDEINAATLSQTVDAEFVRIPEYDPGSEENPNGDGLKVFVVGLNETAAFESRAMNRRVFGVNVAIYNRLQSNASDATAFETEVASMDDYRQEVFELLLGKNTLTNYADAHLVEITNDVVYDPATLDQKQIYLSVMTVKYQVLT